MIFLVGRKIGMTRIFMEEGNSIPVTVIEIEENIVTQVKRNYGIQITTGIKRSNLVKKPELNHFVKAGVQPGRGLWEFCYKKNDSIIVGKRLLIDYFIGFNKVDVTGIAKGKGFSGTVKRWHFSTQDATHGNSLSHRVPGSIGQNQTPGKVFKGKKMSGHLGNNKVTIQSLEIVRLDVKRKFLLVKGSIPGANGGDIIIKPAVKSKGNKNGNI